MSNYHRCERCGAEIRDSMSACPICGYKMEQKKDPRSAADQTIVISKRAFIGAIAASSVVFLVMIIALAGSISQHTQVESTELRTYGTVQTEYESRDENEDNAKSESEKTKSDVTEPDTILESIQEAYTERDIENSERDYVSQELFEGEEVITNEANSSESQYVYTSVQEYVRGVRGTEIGSETIQGIRYKVSTIDDLLDEYIRIDDGDLLRYYTRDGKYLKKTIFRPASTQNNGDTDCFYRECYYEYNQLIFIAAFTDPDDLEKDLIRFYFERGQVIRYSKAGEGIYDYTPGRDADEFFSVVSDVKKYYTSAIAVLQNDRISEYTQAKTISIINGIQAPESDFEFPESSIRLLTQDELNTFQASNEDEMHLRSQMAINEIFVRYGYQFTSSSTSARTARERFGDKDWYKKAQQYCPSQSSDTLLYNYMNSIEAQNIAMINQWQKDHGVYY